MKLMKLMKMNKTVLVVAMATAMPWLNAHAQSPADMQKQIMLLQEQLKALQAQVQTLSTKQSVDPTEFNRLVQKIEVKDEAAQKSGLSDLTMKGLIEARYLSDKVDAIGFSGSGLVGSSGGFAAGNGFSGVGLLEISKQAEGGNGVNWMLRLTPGGNAQDASKIVNEASISVPLGDGAPRVIAGLIPDWTGYEGYFSNQNLLISHNLLFSHLAAVSYLGAGLQQTFGPVTAKAMFANVDGAGNTQSRPGLVYNANWAINEFSYLNFSGTNIRGKQTNTGTGVPLSALNNNSVNLYEVDGGYNRGDLALNAQVSFGSVKNGASNGGDASWLGISALSAYKLTPRLQAVARYDMINNRKNGGGVYGVSAYSGLDPAGLPVAAPNNVFGPEQDISGAVIDPDRGTRRTALAFGLNYAINPSTQWKSELRLDRSSGFNFQNAEGEFKKSNVLFGTALVVSF